MRSLDRRTDILVWMAASFVLFLNPIECIDGSLRERNMIVNEEQTQLSGYKLRSATKYQACVDDLYASDQDGDLKVVEEEYLTFVSTRSRGAIDLVEYSRLPFSLISNFVYGSCFCSFVLKIPNCCVGDNAGININPKLSTFIEDNLITVCRTADLAIRNEIGTFSPTASPSETPSLSPTKSISDFPTYKDSESPTLMPSNQPTSKPTNIEDPTTSAPTSAIDPLPADDLLCLNFQYGIENDQGLTADDIKNGFNNTFKDDLIITTRDITIRILNETLPRDEERRALRRDTGGRPRSKTLGDNPFLGDVTVGWFDSEDEFPSENWQDYRAISSSIAEESTQGQRRAAFLTRNSDEQIGMDNSRRLAFYTDSHPPVVLNIIDNLFCPERDEGIACAVVETRLCVVLEEGDDEEEVKDLLLDGIKTAFKDGSFESALPSEF